MHAMHYSLALVLGECSSISTAYVHMRLHEGAVRGCYDDDLRGCKKRRIRNMKYYKVKVKRHSPFGAFGFGVTASS
eukprot:scaffold230457_cov32-Tisochrysis_lutea.AAC.4